MGIVYREILADVEGFSATFNVLRQAEIIMLNNLWRMQSLLLKDLLKLRYEEVLGQLWLELCGTSRYPLLLVKILSKQRESIKTKSDRISG